MERCEVCVESCEKKGVRVTSRRSRDRERTVSQVFVATRILSSPPSRKTLASSATSRRSFKRSNGLYFGGSSVGAEPGSGVCIIEWRSLSLSVML